MQAKALSYPLASTAVLFVDPLNDFISEGGKMWPYLKDNAARVNLLPNLRRLQSAARAAGVRVGFVPHRRWREGDYEGWRFTNFTHRKTAEHRFFAAGTWGGEWHPDFVPKPGDMVCKEHWTHSGFANTDLDTLLKLHGVSHIVLCGMRTNACYEATARYAVELGYHLTMVKDATAAFLKEEMDATFLNAGPYAHEMVVTEDVVAAFAAAAA
ncbi:isochorismatase family cysteine hydrolase [Ramlibacter albus]|uniref:Cysteine hydrolase n=1 Tax=Ramlibacter albus TaxID=2079448 RepID=A0A923S2A0_9BURK|nr:isochorismatase family cysteine hydrolase [Ramlibacter albus]MBC5765111.1 cysteine hydrolase [Ramlibacter albus]